jgi:CP family cyanate transporter-like MFS transporter
VPGGTPKEAAPQAAGGLRSHVQTIAGGAAVAVLGLVLVAFNQRPAVASVPPVLHELGLGITAEFLLVTIPVLCFGLGALAGPRIRKAFGLEWAVFLLVAVLTAAIAVRAVFLGWTLFPATIVLGLCIANLNVLMPTFIKQRFPGRPGLMTSAYIASATLGPAIAAGLTVPVFHAFGGSINAALGIWALPALVGLLAWTPQLWVARRAARDREAGEVPRRGDAREVPAVGYIPTPIWRHALAWQVMVYMGVASLVFYGPLSWLPQIYQSRGVDAATAGYLLLVMNFVGMLGSTFAPLLMRRRTDVRVGVVVSAAIALVGFVGLIAGPNSIAFFWVVVLGLGQGGQFGLALLMIVIRAADDNVAARLSAMSQSGGYLIAALGPLLMGALHSLTAGWTAPILFLMVANLFGLMLGYFAAKERVIRA